MNQEQFNDKLKRHTEAHSDHIRGIIKTSAKYFGVQVGVSEGPDSEPETGEEQK